MGGSGWSRFGIQAGVCDPLGRFHLVGQEGHLGQDSQGRGLGDPVNRAEALIGTLEFLVLRDPFKGLGLQVLDAALQVANVNLTIAGDAVCVADVVSLCMGAVALSDDRLFEWQSVSSPLAVAGHARWGVAKPQKACAGHNQGSSTHPSDPSWRVACAPARSCSSPWD